MKRIVPVIPVFLACAVQACFSIPCLVRPSPDEFVEYWGAVLAECKFPEDRNLIAESDRPDLVFVRRFENGEWVLARSEHAYTDGAGFNATVFRDSSGSILYQIGHHFCGYEYYV